MTRNDSADTYIIEGADLILPDAIMPHATLAVREGRMRIFSRSTSCRLLSDLPDPAFERAPLIHAADAFVAPSLAEMQCTAAADGFLSGSPARGASGRRGYLLRRKRSGCLSRPFSGTSGPLFARRCDPGQRSSPGALPGIYLEGPFVNPAKRGGIQPENIRPADPLSWRGKFSMRRRGI